MVVTWLIVALLRSDPHIPLDMGKQVIHLTLEQQGTLHGDTLIQRRYFILMLCKVKQSILVNFDA